MPARVTVITATWNKGPRMLRTIESILGQTFGDFEYVVVNDGSTDGTEDLLAGFSDPRLRVIHQANQGLTPTLVETLRHVTTPYIAIQGAGDISHPDRLTRQAFYLDSNPDVVAVGCDREDRDVDGNLIKASSLPFRRLSSLEQAIGRNILNHGEVMFRADAYFRAGGYRPFFKYAQDRDLWLRMIQHGNIVSLPELLYTRITDPRTDVSGNPARTLEQAKLSQYAAHLAKGGLEGRWNNQAIDPAPGYADFEASLGSSEKRAIARRIHSQVRATRMPLAEERKRIETTARILNDLAPGSWMAREIGLRKNLIGLSPALFACYFKLNAAWTRLRRGFGNRRRRETPS
jgi:hypothetical protein